MEYEKRIEELKTLGQASGGDPNEIDEESYSQGFRESWSKGLEEGLELGKEKAMQELNIHTSLTTKY